MKKKKRKQATIIFFLPLTLLDSPRILNFIILFYFFQIEITAIKFDQWLFVLTFATPGTFGMDQLGVPVSSMEDDSKQRYRADFDVNDDC